MMIAGPFAPPILSFAKRENAPCTVEERKRGGGRVRTVCYARLLPAARCGRGLGLHRIGQLLFSLPLASRVNRMAVL